MKTHETYDALYAAERMQLYPAVQAYEDSCGYALDRERLETAARTLACPVKAHAPNWQHGRVIYATVRERLARYEGGAFTLLDIGTAKGFSALCLHWGLIDSGLTDLGSVLSVDVLDPLARVRRNSVAEVTGTLTVPEFLAPWPEAVGIRFLQTASAAWKRWHPVRIPVAFIDGKHTYQAVQQDAALVTAAQQVGDVIVFDDLQVPGIAAAVAELDGYSREALTVLPERVYAVLRREW